VLLSYDVCMHVSGNERVFVCAWLEICKPRSDIVQELRGKAVGHLRGEGRLYFFLYDKAAKGCRRLPEIYDVLKV
jgi:hypothetical protein